jgi:hypothetical protein
MEVEESRDKQSGTEWVEQFRSIDHPASFPARSRAGGVAPEAGATSHAGRVCSPPASGNVWLHSLAFAAGMYIAGLVATAAILWFGPSPDYGRLVIFMFVASQLPIEVVICFLLFAFSFALQQKLLGRRAGLRTFRSMLAGAAYLLCSRAVVQVGREDGFLTALLIVPLFAIFAAWLDLPHRPLSRGSRPGGA